MAEQEAGILNKGILEALIREGKYSQRLFVRIAEGAASTSKLTAS
jgi:hypothetical protein